MDVKKAKLLKAFGAGGYDSLEHGEIDLPIFQGIDSGALKYPQGLAREAFFLWRPPCWGAGNWVTRFFCSVIYLAMAYRGRAKRKVSPGSSGVSKG